MKYFVESKEIEDLYLLPSRTKNKVIVYSPLRGVAFMADEDVANHLFVGETTSKDAKKVLDELSRININSDFPNEDKLSVSENLVFLLSNTCNLGCKYCYAQFNRRNDILSKNKIKSAIDYVFSLHANSSKELDVSFLGGGEPTFHWDLLTWAILYVKKQAKDSNINVRVGFPTNGTLLNEERIRFLADQNVQVGLSFDILPSIQNAQRPFAHSDRGTYDIISKNIDLLNRYSIQTRFRTTIMPDVVSKMEEMVRHTAKRFPYVKKVHFEPTYPLEDDKSLFWNYDAFYADFNESFMSAYKIGKSLGIQVNTAVTNTLNKIKQRYCRGELCVTPNGDIVMCHRASSNEDSRFSALYYGKVDDDGLHINIKDYEAVQKNINNIPKECRECFSKWHCAGMCVSNRMMFSEQHYKSYCKYVRTLQSLYIENIILEGGV